MERKDIERVTPIIRALYLNQKLLVYNIKTEVESMSAWHLGSYGYLLLRPLSSITDDEAIQMCKDFGFENCHVFERDIECVCLTNDKYTVGIFFDGTVVSYQFTGVMAYRTPNWQPISGMYDYLRSQSFALPYYDHATGTTLTPELQQEYGIIKLTQ
jgi:hypothetical protein